MKYTKQPISIQEQIERLSKRGLIFSDEKKASDYLSNISYYRLRAYTYPFQDNVNPDHPFIQKVNFDNIIELYCFDRRLRLLIFNAIEKIEIALRTQIIYHYSLAYGGFWHLNPGLYNNAVYFADHIASLQKETDRSTETFIKHYRQKYNDPKEPPSWMALEVSSIGLLSKIFSNLKKEKCKDDITAHFGLKDIDVLTNWMHCFSVIRNICAHHGRIWNRRLPKITIPRKTSHTFINDKQIYNNKTYAYLSCMLYVLNIISPQHSFKNNLLELMKTCPMMQEKEMGFPTNWQTEPLWK
ncbi:MAG: Abi family protein [Bacteroidales bacterium]|nr:Abi family protein [Bacteroidales bacterium]